MLSRRLLAVQQVLHYSALQAGLSQLPLAVTIIAAAGLASQLVSRSGLKPALLAGLVLFAAGLAWLAQVTDTSSFTAGILGPSLLIGAGLGLAFVALTIGSVTGTAPREAGLASGLINSSQQVGGASGWPSPPPSPPRKPPAPWPQARPPLPH